MYGMATVQVTFAKFRFVLASDLGMKDWRAITGDVPVVVNATTADFDTYTQSVDLWFIDVRIRDAIRIGHNCRLLRSLSTVRFSNFG